jgi:hypothetical protein
VPFHEINDAIGGFGQKRSFQTQQLAMPNRSSKHPAKDVSASSIVRLYTIGRQENQRATVIGDNP